MPDVADFLAGFNLIPGIRIAGFVLGSSRATHETVSRYREYKYQITLNFRNVNMGSYNNLYSNLLDMIDAEYIIKSHYGNPYRCVIDPPSFVTQELDNSYTFYLIGHSYRI